MNVYAVEFQNAYGGHLMGFRVEQDTFIDAHNFAYEMCRHVGQDLELVCKVVIEKVGE